MDGCHRQADQTALVTYKFEQDDVGQNHKIYLATCTPCVEQSGRAFSAHVAFKLGNSSGVRKGPIINEAYKPDVHDVRAPTTPEFWSRVPF